MTAVYRAPMRSARAESAHTVTHALHRGVVGFDESAAGAASGDERMSRRIVRFANVADGAFVWTRDEAGLFWLGRIDGPYRYEPEGAPHGLVHVRPCRWLGEPVLEPEVPAAVQATFRRGGRNFQQTHDDAVGVETQRLWDRHGM